MKICCLVTILIVSVLPARAQNKSAPAFRLGATVSFGLTHIATNNVGIGGLVGAEKRVGKNIAVELEAKYTYFTGDKMLYADGKNKAFSAPVMAGIKAYPASNIYASLRAGAVYFLLNHMSSAKIRPGYGIATGINLPEKANRVNVQVGFTAFHYEGIMRGYATLATAIIIN